MLNVTGINDRHDNDNENENGSFGLRSGDGVYCHEPIGALHMVVFYVALAVGVPGNVLSAVVWRRHGIARKSSSAVYTVLEPTERSVFLLSIFCRVGR